MKEEYQLVWVGDTEAGIRALAGVVVRSVESKNLGKLAGDCVSKKDEFC